MKVSPIFVRGLFYIFPLINIFHSVAGGLCDHPLGNSTVQIQVLGCEWEGKKDTLGIQEGFSKRIVDLPAAMLEVQVTEILDENNDRIQPIWNTFQGIIRTIDLLDTEIMEDLISKEEEKEQQRKGDTGTVRDDVDTPLDANLIKDKEKVRFQYDGELQMIVTIDQDDATEQKCYNNTVAHSFHVIDYMTLFKVRVDLEHEIVKDKIYCDIVDSEKYKIQIHNEVGMDELSGFGDFYKSLDYRTRAALKICSDTAPPVPDGATAEGPCVFDIKHDKDGRNAGLDVSFAAGRPNPFGNNAKNIFFSLTGSDALHHAEFFVEGLFKKGEGNSFSVPTHDPILVLRDPP